MKRMLMLIAVLTMTGTMAKAANPTYQCQASYGNGTGVLNYSGHAPLFSYNTVLDVSAPTTGSNVTVAKSKDGKQAVIFVQTNWESGEFVDIAAYFVFDATKLPQVPLGADSIWAASTLEMPKVSAAGSPNEGTIASEYSNGKIDVTLYCTKNP